MNKIRGFEVVKGRKAKLPVRATKGSAGYDFFLTEDLFLPVGEKRTVWTDIKAYMQEDEFLDIYIRSSIGTKHRIRLICSGLIDSDYYGNDYNDGNIGLAFENLGNLDLTMKKGDRIAQGVFKKYLVADNDNCTEERNGGFGSTGK